MALDETAKLSNIMRSIKKYFVDSLYTAESIQLDFDKSYQDVYAALPERVDQWIIIALNPSNMDSLAELAFTIFMYSRKDPEAVNLFILRDRVMGYLIDTAQTDGLARMTLYDVTWTQIGAAVIVLPAGRHESDNYVAEDGTKFRYISASLRWGAKG
jgi:hypothetical protein